MLRLEPVRLLLDGGAMRVDRDSYDADFSPLHRDPTKCYTCDAWHEAFPCVGCGMAMSHAEFEGKGGRCEPCWEKFRAKHNAKLQRDLARVEKQIRARGAVFGGKW
jgi:uncharacterized paraquat-inducible protein A